MEKELRRPDVLPENVYNMDETGFMPRILSTVKVLIGKSDRRDYRGTGTKQTMVTAYAENEEDLGTRRSTFVFGLW